MTRPRTEIGRWAATCAVWLLILHAVLSGYAGSAHAAAPQLDMFGNVLCLAGAPGEKPGGGHAPLPECCTFGCHAPSPAVGHPAVEAWLPRPLARKPAIGFGGPPVRVAAAFEPASRPRAPPLPA